MRTKVGIILGGRSLCDLDPRIILQKVTQSKPQIKLTAVSTGGHIGQLVTSTERQYIDINVEFAIAEKKDLMARAQILSMVSAWAAMGGRCEVSYRPGLYMDVVCNDLCEVGYVREWTTAYKLTLRAYGVPYWQELRTVSMVASGEVTLYVPGTARTPLEFVAVGTADDDSVEITCNGQKLKFDTLGGAAYTLRIGHANGMFLTASITTSDGTIDAMQHRTTDSNDEIMLEAGNNTITVTSGAAVTLSARGRWI